MEAKWTVSGIMRGVWLVAAVVIQGEQPLGSEIGRTP